MHPERYSNIPSWLDARTHTVETMLRREVCAPFLSVSSKGGQNIYNNNKVVNINLLSNYKF